MKARGNLQPHPLLYLGKQPWAPPMPSPAAEPPALTDVVLFFAGDGVATDLSVLDGREVPAGKKQALVSDPHGRALAVMGDAFGQPLEGSLWTSAPRLGTAMSPQAPRDPHVGRARTPAHCAYD